MVANDWYSSRQWGRVTGTSYISEEVAESLHQKQLRACLTVNLKARSPAIYFLQKAAIFSKFQISQNGTASYGPSVQKRVIP